MQTPTKPMASSKQQLSKENEELRDLCCFLDDGRQKTRRLAHQWQSFGKFTADLLKSEVCVFESKLEILQDNLQKLSRENAELRDVCLFLNQMSALGGHSGLAEGTTKHASQSNDSAQTQDYAVHSACAVKMNKLTLASEQSPSNQDKKQENRRESKSEEKKDMSYISELEQRVERLEVEKLEIIKSLSLAYTLPHTSDCQPLDEPLTDIDLQSPPDARAFLKFIAADSGGGLATSNDGQEQWSTETILSMVTLLDLSRRLDVLRMMPIQDPQEKAEISILTILTSVAWKHLTMTLEGSNQPSELDHERDERKQLQLYQHKHSNLREKTHGSTKVLRTEL